MRSIHPSFFVALVALQLCVSHGYSQRIGLGSDNFTVDAVATTMPYSQTTSDLFLSGSYSFGDTLGGTFDPPYDWSAVWSTLSLELTITGVNPNLPLTAEFYDSSFAVIASMQTSTFGASSTPTLAPLTLTAPGTMLWSEVRGLQLTLNAGGTLDAKVALHVMPEPSTYVLLLAGGSLGGLLIARRRLK
jgi:hypothetical protein